MAENENFGLWGTNQGDALSPVCVSQTGMILV